MTQFNVKVDSAELLDPVAKKIDATFRSDSQPTVTRPEKAFFAETAKQMIELIGFTHWLGLGAVAAVWTGNQRRPPDRPRPYQGNCSSADSWLFSLSNRLPDYL